MQYLSALLAIAIIILSLAPEGSIPRTSFPGWIEHLLSYFVCAFVMSVAIYGKQRALVFLATTTSIFAIISTFLIIIEFSTALTILMIAALFGLCIASLVLASSGTRWTEVVTSIAMLNLAGLLELGQYLSIGRTPHFSDFMASTTGGIAGALLGALVNRIRLRERTKY